MWSDSTQFEYLFCCSQKNVYFSVKGFHSDLSIDDRSLINLGPHLHIWKQRLLNEMDFHIKNVFLGAAEQLFIKVGGIRPHELSQNLFFVEDFPVETAFYFCDIRYLQIHNILGSDWIAYTLWHLTGQTYSIHFQGPSQRGWYMKELYKFDCFDTFNTGIYPKGAKSVATH